MKKAYITPNATLINLNTESPLLGGSILDNGNGGNTSTNPNEEHDGEFDSHRRHGSIWDNMNN